MNSEIWNIYKRVVFKWQPIANLFSERDLNRIDFHIEDIEKGLNFIKEEKLVDAGSGNGIFAIAALQRGKKIISVEKREKKFYFLKELKRTLNFDNWDILRANFLEVDIDGNIPFVLRGVEQWSDFIDDIKNPFYVYITERMKNTFQEKGLVFDVVGVYDVKDEGRRYIIRWNKKNE